MKTVNLIGHLIVDKVFTGFDSIDTLGGIANVWSSLLKLDQHELEDENTLMFKLM